MNASAMQLVAMTLFGLVLLTSLGLWLRIAVRAILARSNTAENRGEQVDFLDESALSLSGPPNDQDEFSLFPLETDRPTEWPLAASILTAIMLTMHFFILTFTILQEIGVLPGKAREREINVATLQINSLIMLAVTGLLFLALLTRPSVTLKQLGFSLIDLPRQVWDGIIGFLLAMAPVLCVLLLTAPLRSVEKQHPFLRALTENGTVELWFWVTFAAVVVAPLSEELLYRVALQGWAAIWIPRGAAISLSTVLFCAAHGYPDMLALIPLAALLGYLYYRRLSYVSVVVTHALFNSFMLFLTGTMSPNV